MGCALCRRCRGAAATGTADTAGDDSDDYTPKCGPMPSFGDSIRRGAELIRLNGGKRTYSEDGVE